MSTDCRAAWTALILGTIVAAGCQDRSAPLPVNSIGTPAPAKPIASDVAPESPVTPSAGEQPAKPDQPPRAADQQPAAGASTGGLFADWPKPELLIVVSGEQLGYIEPCGCAGLENQKGGLSRRHTLLKKLAADGWPLAAFDLGNQVQRFGPQQEIKFHITVEALRTMGYAAVGFGPDDLRLPAGEVISDAASDDNGFVAANVSLLGFEEAVPKFRIIERGGRRLAVTAILGQRAWQKVTNDELAYVPAADALRSIVPKMRAQADTLVLLSHATPDESKVLAQEFKDFKLVVTAGGYDEPPAEPTPIEGTGAWLIEVGHKGMYVAAIGLYADPARPLRYQRVPLDKRFVASPQMHDLMVAYQGQLRDRGFDGLGLQPVAHPSGRKFVGSQACADCHTKAFEVWSKTPHAHATETLVKLDPPRQFDAECVSCHATGWDAQKFFPFASGFVSLDKTPLLKANGCENCHGPGSAHAAAELGEVAVNDLEKGKLREQMRLPLAATERSCMTCHDHDNSPEFNFETYWPKVEHRGKD